MAAATVDINELLEIREGVRQGRPVIRGTRLTVHAIAARYLRGDSAEQICADLPHAGAAGVLAALAYYEKHRPEVERDIAEDEREAIETARELGAEIL